MDSNKISSCFHIDIVPY